MSRDAHVKQMQDHLHKVYGRSVYEIMPQGYRNWEGHKYPKQNFLSKLCELAGVKRKVPMELNVLQALLFSAALRRIDTVMEAARDKFIVLTDIQCAIDMIAAGDETDPETSNRSVEQAGKGKTVKKVSPLPLTPARYQQPDQVQHIAHVR